MPDIDRRHERMGLVHVEAPVERLLCALYRHRWAMRHARYHVLVVDHSKFGKVRPARMGALAKFDVIASDICPDDELVALAKAQQISLLY